MYRFNRNTRTLGLARSSSIVKSIWVAALSAILGVAGVVAKINPGKPVNASTAGASSSTAGSGASRSSYNVFSPTLSAPPSTPVSPQPNVSSGSSGGNSSSQSSPPAAASGGS